MKRTLILLGLLLPSLLAAQDKPADTSSPKKPEYVAEEGLHLVPSNYGTLFDDATLVVRVRIMQSEPYIAKGTMPLPLVFTIHTAQVIDVVKGGAKPGDTVKFWQLAGRAETDEYIVVSRGPQPLAPGHEYVVFLKPRPADAPGEGFALVSGVEGAFEIAKGRIKAMGRSEIAQERNGMSEERFLGELRGMAIRRHEAQK